MKLNRIKLSKILAGTICILTMLATGCNSHHNISKPIVNDGDSYCKVNVPEQVELIETIEDGEKWEYRCVNRDIQFLVARRHEVDIDSSVIWSDYQDKVLDYYNDTMTEILRRHCLLGEEETIFDYSDTKRYSGQNYILACKDYLYSNCSSFRIIVKQNTFEKDCQETNALLNDVRQEIVQKEQSITGTILPIRYQIFLKTDDNRYWFYDMDREIDPDTEIDVKKEMLTLYSPKGIKTYPSINEVPIELLYREEKNEIKPFQSGLLIGFADEKHSQT